MHFSNHVRVTAACSVHMETIPARQFKRAARKAVAVADDRCRNDAFFIATSTQQLLVRGAPEPGDLLWVWPFLWHRPAFF